MLLRKQRVNINVNHDYFDKSLSLIKKLEAETIQENIDLEYKVL